MEHGCSFTESADMHLGLGRHNYSPEDAVESIPDRHFLSVGLGLQKTGTFHATQSDVGLVRSVGGAACHVCRTSLSAYRFLPTAEGQQLCPFHHKMRILSAGFQQFAEASKSVVFLSRTNRPLLGLNMCIVR
jgi:hypothetical protein